LATVVRLRGTHETFDALIRATVMRALAGRMKGLARTTDLVGRLGEDQLGLLLRGVGSRNEALRIARTVYESLVDAPVTTAAEEIMPLVACGVGFAELGDDLADLIAEASAPRWNEAAASPSAMDAPRARTGRSDALPTMDEFRIAMSHGDVRSYARPVVHLGSGLIAGYEGSARWHHRRLGTLDALAFVDMISETLLANQVDLFVARETAAVLALTTRDRPLSMYAPASTRLIADVRTEQYLCEIVDAFSLSMDQMHLEVARVLEDNWTPALVDALQSLRDAGFTLVAADVEVASDARRLVEVGFGELHLSRSLTNALTTGAGARHVVSEIVQIAHGRGVLVAGAGVNDAQHHQELVEAGCDLATGDLYGAAEPANTID
jgi:EAL domain-containing protein (putative c-di-GMP-specific phosphodiesterase class I)